MEEESQDRTGRSHEGVGPADRSHEGADPVGGGEEPLPFYEEGWDSREEPDPAYWGEEDERDQEADPGGEDEEDFVSLAEQEFLVSVARGERAIQKEDPGFDMEREFTRNPMFALLIASGYDSRRVYEFFYPGKREGRLKQAIEREVMDRIRLRNTRPLPIGGTNATASRRDVSRMSDEEIRDIDARIRRGERVKL